MSAKQLTNQVSANKKPDRYKKEEYKSFYPYPNKFDSFMTNTSFKIQGKGSVYNSYLCEDNANCAHCFCVRVKLISISERQLGNEATVVDKEQIGGRN